MQANKLTALTTDIAAKAAQQALGCTSGGSGSEDSGQQPKETPDKPQAAAAIKRQIQQLHKALPPDDPQAPCKGCSA